MTDNTKPEALDLADWLEAVGGGPSAKRCAALLREQHARIAELESELEAIGAGGVSGPLVGRAAPKAAPGELHDHQILAITTAYEQGVGKGRQAHESGKEIDNPYGTGYRCDLAWQYGYEEGKKQAERIAEAAPQQEAQEPAFWMNEKGHTWSHSDWKQFPKHRAKYPIPLYPHFPAPQPAPAPLSDDDVRDAAFEAVRKKLCALPRFSFLSDRFGVRRVPDKSGSWIAFDAAHELFDPVAVDAAIAAQRGNK